MQGPEYEAKLSRAQEIEQTRQALVRGEATNETFAYAKFLCACENDATLTKPRFSAGDGEVMRAFPIFDAKLKVRDEE
jgi:hypothetical protein